MAMSKIYPSEPGIRVSRMDGGVLSPQTIPTTDTLLIVGVAVDGPSDRPVWFTNINDLLAEYGPTDRRPELAYPSKTKGFNGNTISRAAQEAWDAGCRSIIVRRVGGTHAETYIRGYNYVTDSPITISLTGSAALPYGRNPYPNDEISAAPGTITTINGAQVRYTAPATVTAGTIVGGLIGWSFYVPSQQWESPIVAMDGTTITLRDNPPTSVTSADPFYIYPRGAYSVFDKQGAEFNPANFLVTEGSTSAGSSISVRPEAIQDSRYLRSVPEEGEVVYVNHYMYPNRLITLRSMTPSNVYNASGTFGTNSQDGCWATIMKEGDHYHLKIYIPKFRNSPVESQTRIPVAAVDIALNEVSTLEDLVNKINSSKFNTSVVAEIATDAHWNGTPVVINPLTGGTNLMKLSGGNAWALDDTPPNEVRARFIGGSTGMEMSKEAYYNTLVGVGNTVGVLDELITNIPAAYRYIAGVYADETVNGRAGAWTEVLAHHCWTASRLGYGCQGVIGVTPLPLNKITAAAVSERVLNLTSGGTPLSSLMMAGLHGIDDTAGTEVDIGQYINVLAGPDGFTRDPYLGRVYSNNAALYAGLLCQMPITRSTTSFPLKGSSGLAYNYNRHQLNELIVGVGMSDVNRGAAYTPFRLDMLTGGVVVHSGETAARRESQFTKESTVKIVQAAEIGLAAAARPFLGQPNILQVHQALQFACEQFLEGFAKLGALQGGNGVGYSVSLSFNEGDKDIGRVRLDVALRTAVEIRTIHIPVTVEF